MATILSPQTLHDRHNPRRTTALFLLLCGLPVVYFGLLFTTTEERRLYTMAVYALRPLITLIAIGLLLSAAWRDRGHRRWTWIFLTVSMFCGVIFNSIRIIAGPSLATPFLQVLVIVIYVSSLIGAALYLQKRVWSVGSTWRVLVGGVTVGIASLILMRACLPLIITRWSEDTQVNAILAYLAFDIGILFALGVIALRHKRGSSPFIPLVLLCILCLFAADALTLSARLYEWQRYWAWPFYTLHNVLLAIAAYSDAIHPDLPANPTPTLMPLVEWLLWTQIPFLFVVAAFGAASFSGANLYLLLTLLIIAAIAYETLAVLDYRRVWHALYDANRQLQAYATQAADLAAERERTRIARDIHDSLGHYFTGIGSQLQATEVLLDVKRDRALSALTKARGLADEGLDEVRRSIVMLRENPLGMRSLPEAIGVLLDNAKSAHIAVQLDLHGTPRSLDADRTLSLYRTAQEGITNILKYAQARSIHVILDYRATNHITLIIRDDGQGAETTEGGFGLLGIRERIEILGGTMQVDTKLGHGFLITVEVPV